MQFKKIVFFAILSTLLFTGCSDSKESSDDKKSQKFQYDRKVLLMTTQQQFFNASEKKNGLIIEELKGKAVLVNFFATWCNPCKAEIPHLNHLRQKYKDQFEVIGVLLESNKSHEEVEAFMKEHKVAYPVTNGLQNYKLAKVLGGVRSIPTMFMYDKNGNVMQKYVGLVPEEMLEIDIKKAIK